MTVAATPMARREVKNLAQIEIFGRFRGFPLESFGIYDPFDRSLGVVAL